MRNFDWGWLFNFSPFIFSFFAQCVENVSRSNCPVCLGDIHTSRYPCHIPDCGHLLHKTCFDQLVSITIEHGASPESRSERHRHLFRFRVFAFKLFCSWHPVIMCVPLVKHQWLIWQNYGSTSTLKHKICPFQSRMRTVLLIFFATIALRWVHSPNGMQIRTIFVFELQLGPFIFFTAINSEIPFYWIKMCQLRWIQHNQEY